MKHLPTLVLLVLTVSGIKATWYLITLTPLPLTTWAWFALFCFGVSAVFRLIQLVSYWSRWRELNQPAPVKETPVVPLPEPRWDATLSPDTILSLACHYRVCGAIGTIQTSRSAYVREEMQHILTHYVCTNCQN